MAASSSRSYNSCPVNGCTRRSAGPLENVLISTAGFIARINICIWQWEEIVGVTHSFEASYSTKTYSIRYYLRECFVVHFVDVKFSNFGYVGAQCYLKNQFLFSLTMSLFAPKRGS